MCAASGNAWQMQEQRLPMRDRRQLLWHTYHVGDDQNALLVGALRQLSRYLRTLGIDLSDPDASACAAVRPRSEVLWPSDTATELLVNQGHACILKLLLDQDRTCAEILRQ